MPLQNASNLTVDQVQDLMRTVYKFDQSILDLFLKNRIDGSTVMCMQYYPSFMPTGFSHEVKLQKLFTDLTGNELKFQNNDAISSMVRSFSNASFNTASNSNDCFQFKTTETDQLNKATEQLDSWTCTQTSNDSQLTQVNSDKNLNPELSLSEKLEVSVKKANKKISLINYPAPLPILASSLEEELIKGDPMMSLNAIIKSTADYYLAHNIEINKMQDYEVVCKSLLSKYSRLNQSVSDLCRLENASPQRKSVKRLNPHRFMSKNQNLIAFGTCDG